MNNPQLFSQIVALHPSAPLLLDQFSDTALDAFLSGLEELKSDKPFDLSISIDLETPGSRGVGIFTAGLAPFAVLSEKVYYPLGVTLQADFVEMINFGVAHGNDSMGDTLRWWLDQAQEARDEVANKIGRTTPRSGASRPLYSKGLSPLELCQCIEAYFVILQHILPTNATIRPMGNSNSFDVTITKETALAVGVQLEGAGDGKAWSFWDVIDLRTALYLCKMVTGKSPKKSLKRTGVHHKALDDAFFQAELFVACYKNLCNHNKPVEEPTDGKS